MRPLQSRAWTRRGEEEEEDEDGVVDFPLCKLPPRAEIYRRRRRSRSRRIPSFFHLERLELELASTWRDRQTDRQNLGRNGESVGECVELDTEVCLLCKKD